MLIRQLHRVWGCGMYVLQCRDFPRKQRFIELLELFDGLVFWVGSDLVFELRERYLSGKQRCLQLLKLCAGYLFGHVGD